MKTINLFLVLLILLLLNCACSSNKPAGDSPITQLGPEDFKKIIDQPGVVNIDVQIPPQKALKKTDKYIPYNEITDHLEKLPVDKNSPIALYCLSGPRATKAAEDLQAMGYKKIYVLRGGTIAWKQKGYGYEE